MSCKPFFKILLLIFLLINTAYAQQPRAFYPGEVWNDTGGQPINAHKGCVIFYKGRYYWYGEIIIRPSKVKSVVAFDGISCYVSTDLLHWGNKGVALSQGASNTQSILTSPRVIYNKASKKFAMWLHLDPQDGHAAQFGIAVSNTPAGPFKLIRVDTNDGRPPGEMTTFRDDNGKAYLFYVDGDSFIHVRLLTEDYLRFEHGDMPVLAEKSGGAPVVFKHHGKYYLMTSGAAPYLHGDGLFSVADHLTGQWKTIGSPFMGPGYATSYQSRGTFALPLKKTDVTCIYMADRWDDKHPDRSTYVWLPMGVNEEGMLEVPWQESWKFIK